MKKNNKYDIKLNNKGDFILKDGIKEIKKEIKKLLKNPKSTVIRTPIKDSIDFISLNLEIKDGEVNVMEDKNMESLNKVSLINQYKKEDGYYDEDLCFYEDAENFIQSHVLNFCGCGDPEENLKYIRDGLNFINRKGPSWPQDQKIWDNWHEEHKKEELQIFGSLRTAYFFYYWADTAGLTEHGGSIPGWLTPKGEGLLNDLNGLYDKEGETNGL